MHGRLALALLCSLHSPCRVAGREQKTFDDVIEEANTAHKAQDFRQAAKRFQAAFRMNASSAHAARFLGDSWYKLGEFGKGRQAALRAHKLDPEHRSGRKFLADVLAANGKLQEALWHFGQIAVSSQITLPPLGAALVEPWTTHPSKHPATTLEADETEEARVFFMDPIGVPKEALTSLRDFLSTDIVGESYAFEFRSSSLPLGPLDSEPGSLLEQAIQLLRRHLPPAAREAAQCAEWWVHRRPPKRLPKGVKRMALEGHPFHWDNDGDEANGSNPLFTSLLYLTKAVGPAAPTVVLNTSKTESGFYVGDAAWVIPAAEGRVAYLHGGMLHGVLPSAGSLELPKEEQGDDETPKPPMRLSLNVAWWPWECRVPEKVASVEGVPPVDEAWAATLRMGLPARRLSAPHPVFDVFCGDDLCGRKAQGQQEL